MAKAKVTITGDSRDAQRAFDSLGKKTQQLGRKMTSFGKDLSMKVTAPLAALGGVAFRSSMKFNEAMANVGTLIPGNTERVKELKEEVQDLSVEMGTGTNDMASGLYQVVSAFQDSADTAEILEINAKAAVGGVSDVRSAIDLTSAVTKAYGDTTAEAVQRASDLALMTVRMGQTTFPELAGAIGRVTPFASSLNVRMEELFGSMATLTGVTGNAAEVSTQLRGILGALIKPTDSMKKAISELGYSSAEALIQEKGLQGALEALIGTTDGSNEALGDLIRRKEALTGVMALTGAQADTFTNKLGDMEQAAGTTDEAFEEQTQGINKMGFAWNQFTSRMSVAAQDLGDLIAPMVIDLTSKIGELVGWFQDLTPETQRWIVKVSALAAALGPVITAAGLLVMALGALLSPIGAVIAGIAGLSAIGYKIVKDWDEIKNTLNTYWDLMAAQFDNTRIAILIAWNKMKQGIYTAIEGIVKAFSPLQHLPGKFGKAFEDMQHSIENKSSDASDNIADLKDDFKENQEEIGESTEALNDTFSKGYKGITGTVSNFKDRITDILSSGNKTQKENLTESLKKRGEAWTEYYNKLKGTGTDVEQPDTSAEGSEDDEGGEEGTGNEGYIERQVNKWTMIQDRIIENAIDKRKEDLENEKQWIDERVSYWEKYQNKVLQDMTEQTKKENEERQKRETYQQNVQDNMMEKYRKGQIKASQLMQEEQQKRTERYKTALQKRWGAYQNKLDKEKEAEAKREEYHKNVQDRMMEAYRKGQIKASRLMQEEMKKRKKAIEQNLSFLKESMQRNFAAILKGTKSVTEAFKSIWQSVIDAVIQQLAKMAAMKVFKWVVSMATGGIGGAALSLLGFAEGGVVPGPKGQPRLAVVHGQEQVLTPDERRNNGGVNIKITGNKISSDYDIDRIGDRLVKKLRRAGVITT